MLVPSSNDRDAFDLAKGENAFENIIRKARESAWHHHTQNGAPRRSKNGTRINTQTKIQSQVDERSIAKMSLIGYKTNKL
jgi:hypothetical protein